MAQCPYSYFEYEAQTGDTLGSLAEKFAVSEQALRERNGNDEPAPGVRVKIPCPLGGCGCGVFYAVRRGESLLHIARRNGLALADLLAANPYLNPDYVVTGQVIVIPPTYRKPEGTAYTLAEGEGLFDVLRKFGMDLTAFCALNPGQSPMDIKPGQRVNVKHDTDRKGRWYTLGPDEGLLSVAQRHGISIGALLSANERLRPSDFVPGMPVRLPG